MLALIGRKPNSKGLARLPAVFFLRVFFNVAAMGDQTASLAWNASTDTNVVGYVLSYGNTSGIHPVRVGVGANTVGTVRTLTPGQTYFFVVTAYNAEGVESGPSNEVAFIVPGTLALMPGLNPGDPMRLKFPVSPSHWYEVQASANLRTWATVWQTAAGSNYWAEFDDPQSQMFKTRFYRLVLH